MTIFDITRPVSATTAVWPGDRPFSLQWRMRMSEGGFVNQTEIQASLHTGTHVDAPLHVRDDGASIDSLDLTAFVGPAQVVSVSPGEAGLIGPDDLREVDFATHPRLLLRTTSADDPERFEPEFVSLAPSIPAWLAERGCVLVGLDTPGVDPYSSTDLPVHRGLVDAGLAWIENLDLRGIEPGPYELVALPLKLVGAEASPVRAVLLRR